MFEHFGQNLILLERLAAGGMGEVYRAKQMGKAGFDKTVAVKMILPHYAARPEFKAMFEQEMRICARLQHPNVAQVFSTGEWNGYLYLVMEFIDGMTVRDLIQRCLSNNTRIPPEYLCLICSAVACGLSYAHGIRNEETGELIQLVHRDISPQNIMIGFNGEVKILDFGVAKSADSLDLTKPGDLKGNISYLSPEAIEAQRLDGRADIFSLGIIAHELVTLKKLFYGSSAIETINNILALEIPNLQETRPDFPTELAQIINKTLARNRDNRYLSAEELQRDLSKFTSKAFPDLVSTDLGAFLSKLFEEERQLTGKERKRIKDLWFKTESSLKRNPTEGSGSFSSYTGAPSNFLPDQTLPGDSQIYKVRTSTFLRIPAIILIVLVLIFTFFNRKSLLKKTFLSGQQKPVSWFKIEELGSEGQVSNWPASGNRTLVATQPEPDRQPVLTRLADSSNKVLAFDGINDFLTANQIAVNLREMSEFTVMIQAKIKTAQKQTLWSTHLHNRNDLVRTYIDSRDRLIVKWGTNSNPKEAASAPQNLKEMSLISTVIRENEIEVFLNGISVVRAKLNSKLNFQEAAYFSLGQEYDWGSASDFLSGEIADFAVFPQALQDRDRIAYEKMFSNKFRR